MLFAIPALITVGLSWALTGVVMSDAPRKKCDTGLLLLVSGLISSIISLSLCFFLQKTAISTKVLLLTGGCYFLGSAINFCMLQIMSYSMQRGPNGVIWSIIQSALVFPFLCGVIFYGNELSLWRAAGLLLILLSLACLGKSKDNQTKGKNWKLSTFAAFILAGIVLSLNSLPSYYPAARELNSMGRSFFSCMGSLLAAFIWCYPKYRLRKKEEIWNELKRPILWKYIFTLKLFGLICAYLLLYPGLDAMAKAGAGCVSYPLIIGSCIMGFNLYSLFIMKEKWSFCQAAGVVFCIAGEVFLV